MKIYIEILVTCIFLGAIYGWKAGVFFGIFYLVILIEWFCSFKYLIKEVRKIEKTYNDDESEKDIQRFVEEFINEKENPKDEFEIILNGTTGKEMRWAIYSILAKQKQKQEYQSQRISSLQRVVILQGMAVIVLGLSIIIFKQCLLWQMLLQQNERKAIDMKSILKELIAIKRELQAIRKLMESSLKIDINGHEVAEAAQKAIHDKLRVISDWYQNLHQI